MVHATEKTQFKVSRMRLKDSIGWETVTDVFKAKSFVSSVVILASFKTNYEFIFTCEEVDFIETMATVFKAFRKSQLFRQTMLRSSDLLLEGEVVILKKEILFEKLLGVFHLSGEVGTIGNLIITNVRLVWYSADALSNLNIPYLQIVNIKYSLLLDKD